MTEEQITLLESCINKSSLTEDQLAFLNKWYLVVTDSQVTSMNNSLSGPFKISAIEKIDGTKVLPSFLLIDTVTYGPIIDDLNSLQKVELQDSDFFQIEEVESPELPALTDEERAEALALFGF